MFKFPKSTGKPSVSNASSYDSVSELSTNSNVQDSSASMCYKNYHGYSVVSGNDSVGSGKSNVINSEYSNSICSHSSSYSVDSGYTRYRHRHRATKSVKTRKHKLCMYCGRLGHRAKYCWKRQGKCLCCGDRAHKSEKCPNDI